MSAAISKLWGIGLSLQSKIFIFITVLLLLIAFEWIFFTIFESKVLQEEMGDRGAEYGGCLD